MDGEHTYEINLKKDDLFICLSSDDVYFISKQMDKWFRILLDDSYVPVSMPKPVIAPPPAPEPLPAAPVEEPVAQAQPQPASVPPPVAAPAPEPMPVVAEAPPAAVEVISAAPPPPPESVVAAQPEPAAAVLPVAPMPEPVAMVETPVAAAVIPEPTAAAQPGSALASPEPLAEPVAAPPTPAPVEVPVATKPAAPPAAAPPVAPLDPAVSDDFEAVMDSLMKDFEDEEEASAPVATAAPESNGNGRMEESALPDLSTIASLAELCDQARATSSEDYLLLSAYYLTDFESLPKFSLKRVNSMLVKSGLTPVNHSVLETTMTRGYLSMVPDLTGMADVSEYVMTEEGREAAVRLL